MVFYFFTNLCAKFRNKFIAITYVSFRIIECLLLIVGVIVYLLLLTLSKEFANAGSPDGSYFQTMSTLSVEIRYGAYHIAMITLGIGSLFLCYLLYQSKLIPRFISVVGLIGYALLLLSAPLDIVGLIDTTGVGGIMYVPGALFELFLFPIWLIVKGFNSSTIDSGTA